MSVTLRPFQSAGVDEVRAEFQRGTKAILLESPTGSGKTVVWSHITQRVVERGKKVLFLCHRKELVEQSSRKLDDNSVPHGVIKSGHHRVQPWQPVQIASVATLINRPTLPEADFIGVDEAHHSPSKSFMSIIERYPNARILGLTATPCRLDGRGLGVGNPGGYFQKIVRLATISELIEQGYLVTPRTFAPDAPDLASVEKVGSDYNKGQLAKAMDRPTLVGDLVKTWLTIASGRTTVVFACSIEHSKHIVKRFREAGVSAEHLDADTPDGLREAILARVASGETTVVSNVAILTEGWDLPRVSCVVMARPTLSLSLYLQMPGRGLRPWLAKTDCIILDHAGNSLRHGLITDDREFSLDGVNRSANGPKPRALKTCPRCKSPVPTSLMLCDRLYWDDTICGHVFVAKKRVIIEKAGELRERGTEEKAAGRQAIPTERKVALLARWITEARRAKHESVAPYMKFRGFFKEPASLEISATAAALSALDEPVLSQAQEERAMEARG